MKSSNCFLTCRAGESREQYERRLERFWEEKIGNKKIRRGRRAAMALEQMNEDRAQKRAKLKERLASIRPVPSPSDTLDPRIDFLKNPADLTHELEDFNTIDEYSRNPQAYRAKTADSTDQKEKIPQLKIDTAHSVTIFYFLHLI